MHSARDSRLYELILALQTGPDEVVDKFELIETHISYILLYGDYAYKFKKPVDLGFLDFSSLDKRKYYCEEELRLNRRLAPELYIKTVAITGDEERPLIDGEGAAIEFAVKMRRFPAGNELKTLLHTNGVVNKHIDDFAMQIAGFHGRASVASFDSSFGSMQVIADEARDNFCEIAPFIKCDSDYSQLVNELKDWTEQALQELSGEFRCRQQQGFIRECHGDMHSGNIVLYKDKLLGFDCIEFSEEFRWIDTMSDLGFLLMDLDVEGKPEYAWRILNGYLQNNGHYGGLSVLNFYKIFRALVRVKVSCIRLQQDDIEAEERKRQIDDYRRHLEMALAYSRPDKPKLLITYGLSGCGKTTISQSLAEQLGAIILRSDIERKRLYQFTAEVRTASRPGEGIYSETGFEKTYLHLAGMAKTVIRSGYSVIVDAAFLQHKYRQHFMILADELAVPFVILDINANEKELYRRIKKRREAGIDASEADNDVLYQQIKTHDALTRAELQNCINIDTNRAVDIKLVSTLIKGKSGDKSGLEKSDSFHFKTEKNTGT